MQLKYKTLQSSLFAHFSIFFIISMLIIAISLYSYFANDMYKKASDQQAQLCTSLLNSIDSTFRQMNTISMNILYSSLIKSHFQNYLSLPKDGTAGNTENYERYSSINALMDVIMAINGPLLPVSQTNIYDLEGHMVGTGRFNGEIAVDLNKVNWYKKTLELNGDKYIGVPTYLEWLNNMNILYKNDKYISLARVYKNSNNENQGIIETLQDCDSLFKYVNDTRSKDTSTGVLIFNRDGQCVYPYRDTSEKDSTYYFNLIKKKNLDMLQIHGVDDQSGTAKLAITYTTSDYTGWTVIVLQSESTIYKSVNRIAELFIIFSIFAIIITLIISYLISKNVTSPLKELRNDVKAIELADLPVNFMVKTRRWQSIDEIEKLRHAFIEMNKNLSISLNEILISKNEEMNAKMLALQSQMNPHFLYNNLATINVMAEEGMNSQIISLCRDVSYMLRYISSENRDGIKLSEEIEYTQKYLDCMKLRYESNLEYDINLEKDMLELVVPKLIIQPAVENSIKFSLKNPPPWCIFISGKISNDKWLITVKDNGAGFDISELDKIQQFKNKYKDFSTMPSLQIGGMGLPNIYIRLRLMYRDSTVFEADNNPEGGAIITIGGSMSIFDRGK